MSHAICLKFGRTSVFACGEERDKREKRPYFSCAHRIRQWSENVLKVGGIPCLMPTAFSIWTFGNGYMEILILSVSCLSGKIPLEWCDLTWFFDTILHQKMGQKWVKIESHHSWGIVSDDIMMTTILALHLLGYYHVHVLPWILLMSQSFQVGIHFSYASFKYRTLGSVSVCVQWGVTIKLPSSPVGIVERKMERRRGRSGMKGMGDCPRCL